jgi:hypothetical protein
MNTYYVIFFMLTFLYVGTCLKNIERLKKDTMMIEVHQGNPSYQRN